MKKDSDEHDEKNSQKKSGNGVKFVFIFLIAMVIIAWKSDSYEFFELMCSLLVIVTVYFKVKYPNDKTVDSFATIIIGSIIASIIIGIVMFISCINALKSCN